MFAAQGTMTDVWISGYRNGEIPSSAIVGGYRKSPLKQSTYVGRVCYNGELIPGRIVPSLGTFFFSYNGKECKTDEYETLVENGTTLYSWEYCSGGNVPYHAVNGGSAANGELLYVGRFSFEGGMHIGKVQRSYNACLISYYGKELTSRDYEVLVARTKIGFNIQPETPSAPILQTLTWLPASDGQIPRHDAVIAGTEGSDTLYVARALHNDNRALIPGKIVPSHKVCYVGTDWKEFAKSKYEVLVDSNSFRWVPCNGTNIPCHAVPGGHNVDKTILYIARARHNGILTPGKANREDSCCYIPYGGKEHKYCTFEVLVWK